MIETELGKLRRSHYSDELNPSMDGTPGHCDGMGLNCKRSWKY